MPDINCLRKYLGMKLCDRPVLIESAFIKLSIRGVNGGVLL